MVVSGTSVTVGPVVVVGGRAVVVDGRGVTVVAGTSVVVVGSAVVVVVAGAPVPVRRLRSVPPSQTTTTAPVWLPAVVGAKATAIVHGDVTVPAVQVPPVRVKGPVTLTELRVTGAAVANVRTCGALRCPTVVDPNARLDGVSVGGAAWAKAVAAHRSAATDPVTRARIVGVATTPPYAAGLRS
ncbi:MAG: hypothetical protein ACR2HM_10305 [Acidimicrobiales bacterium]